MDDIKDILIDMFNKGFLDYNLHLNSVRVILYKLGISERDISLRSRNW